MQKYLSLSTICIALQFSFYGNAMEMLTLAQCKKNKIDVTIDRKMYSLKYKREYILIEMETKKHCERRLKNIKYDINTTIVNMALFWRSQQS